MTSLLHAYLQRSPFIAILRGITPDEAVPVGEALWTEGWRIVEVPLNSPEAFESIARLCERFGDEMLIGAGTVRREQDVARLRSLGARLMVCPHIDAALVRHAKTVGLIALPGVSTPTECFQALDASADGLKLFPAETLGAGTLRALRSVLPATTTVLPVGGISPDNLAEWRKAGGDGFGIGGALYRPGDAPATVRAVAQRFNAAWAMTQAGT